MPEESMGPSGPEERRYSTDDGEVTDVNPETARNALLAQQLVQGNGDEMSARQLWEELADRDLSDEEAREAVNHLVALGRLEFVLGQSQVTPGPPMQPYPRDETGLRRPYELPVGTTAWVEPTPPAADTARISEDRFRYVPPTPQTDATGTGESK